MARWKRCWSFRPPSIRAAPLTRRRRAGFGRTVAEHELTRIRGLADRLRKPRNGRGRKAATPARINRFSTPHECRDCPGDLSPRFWSDRRREARRPCSVETLCAARIAGRRHRRLALHAAAEPRGRLRLLAIAQSADLVLGGARTGERGRE